MSRRNVVQLEPSGSTRHVRSSCVSSPHQSSWKLHRCTLLDSCLPQSNAHLLYPRPLAATKNNVAQKHTAQQWHRESELGWFGNSCFQSWINGHRVCLNAITQITSITSAKSWMICQESGTKLSSYWGGKIEIFVKACKNYSSPRTSATMSNGSYKLLQQASPKQIFPFLYTALILIALHRVTYFSLSTAFQCGKETKLWIIGIYYRNSHKMWTERSRELNISNDPLNVSLSSSLITLSWDFLRLPGLFPHVHN